MRNCEMEVVKDLVDSFLQKKKYKKNYEKALLFNRWESIVGEHMARQILPQYMEFNILYVYAKSSVWANQFNFLKLTIIEKIKDHFHIELKDILLTRNKKRKEKSKAAEEIEYLTQLDNINLGEKAEFSIKASTSKIKNEALKEKLARIITLSKKRKALELDSGYKECIKCRATFLDGEKNLCYHCEKKEMEDRIDTIKIIFQKKPEISYQDMLETMPHLTKEEYNTIKDNLLLKWLMELRPGFDYEDKRVKNSTTEYSQKAKKVIALYRGIAKEDLTNEVMDRTMKFLKSNTAFFDIPEDLLIKK